MRETSVTANRSQLNIDIEMQRLQRLQRIKFRKWFIFWGNGGCPGQYARPSGWGCCEQGFRLISLDGTKREETQPGNRKKTEIPDFIFYFTF